MEKLYVKFRGKFTDLIPNGWTFQKLFGRNYRQYHKTCDGEQYSQGCRIWQHLGSYLEIADLFNDSYLIVKQIQDGKINEWGSEIKKLFTKTGEKETVYWLILDAKEHKFHPYHSEEYKRIYRQESSQFEAFQNSVITKKEYETWAKNYQERYRKFNMRPELIPMIQDLLDKGWIRVEEDKRTS